jgi:hypothetical protein
LKLDSTQLAASTDTRELTWKILDQDRRRVRRWVIVAVVLWLLAATGIVGAFVAFGLLFPAHAKAMQQAGVPEIPEKLPAEIQSLHLVLTAFLAKISFLVALSVLVLVLATLATLLVVLVSRRATLRQINANLIAISEQLRQAPPKAS